ncbi:MAG: glycosyltransferase [Pseudobutyrivibrio sp.]|nr:glycosyltransferase [Pseudobutyrivibrio sp.]
MKKKILIICQHFYPEQFRINDIAFEWVNRGYEVSVVTGTPNYPTGHFLPGYNWFKNTKETVNGVAIHRIPLIPPGNSRLGLVFNYLSFPFFGFWWNLFTKEKADFVFMFETSPMHQCKVGVRYAKRHNVPAYLYVQDLWPENFEMITGISHPLIIKPLTRMVEKIYGACAHLWGTSPTFVEAMQKRVPESEKDKITFWPQFAEDFYQPKEKVFHEGFNLMFTGNIGEAQGLEILPEAAAILKERGIDDITFTIVGDGRARESFEKSIADAGVSDYFVLTGRKNPKEIPGLLATADAAFISFKDSDIFERTIPAKLQSYMACAMPILAAAKGETIRVITEANCGMASPLGDAQALAENILAMRDLGHERLLEMGDNAYRYNKANFDKEKLMDQICEFIENDLKDRPGIRPKKQAQTSNVSDVCLGSVIYSQAEEYLPDLINSINNQTNKKFDLLLVNDNYDQMPDLGLDIQGACTIHDCSDMHLTPGRLRVELMRKAKEMGYHLLVFIDADDTMSPTRMEAYINAYKMDKKATFFYNELVTDSGEIVLLDLPKSVDNVRDIAQYNFLGMGTTAVNLDRIPEEFLDSVAAGDTPVFDWYFYSRMLLDIGGGKLVKNATTIYRIGENNMVGIHRDLLTERSVKLTHYENLARLYPFFGELYDELKQVDLNTVDEASNYKGYWWSIIRMDNVK